MIIDENDGHEENQVSAMQAAGPGDHEQAARTIGVRELKSRTDDIVREVTETGRPIDIALGDKIVARLSPTQTDETRSAENRRQAMLDWLRETEAFAQEVARRWPSSISSVELLNDQRRDLCGNRPQRSAHNLGSAAAGTILVSHTGLLAGRRPVNEARLSGG